MNMRLRKTVALVPPVFNFRVLLLPCFYCLVYLAASLCHAQTQLPAVNVALNKQISANITCGSPAETFTAHSESDKSPQDRVESVCDASNASFAHPPENMVDPDPTTGEVYTWWQSTSRLQLLQAGFTSPDAEIILDLQEVYTVQSVVIQMGDSVRPGQLGMEKSLDGRTFTPWFYQVSELVECSAEFGIPPVTAVVGLDTVLCTTYTSNEQIRNEMISFSLSSPAIYEEWQRTRYIKFNFYNMQRSFGFFSDEFHHYTVRNLEVLARCECNDHATNCILQPLTSDPTKMTYQCVCGDNTRGETCNECLPFYNQLAYQPGTNGFVCEECNCFNHSNICVYDETVNSVNGSLNAQGNYVGGGVCQDCRNFTTGVNCHMCVQFYFRPVDKMQSDEDACQPCGCFLPGTREDPSTGLVRGECVMNNDLPNPAGMAPGDCFCKVNVQGSKCDECKDEFYDLTDANSNGCLGCDCFTDGTVNGSNVCIKNSTGQCPCKTFTEGRRCDVCRDGYYGLSSADVDGCTDCGCDVGGAESPVCDKLNGDCPCRDLVVGQQCKSVAAGAFYPTLHSIRAEFESLDHPYWRRDFSGYFGYGYVELSGMVNTSTILTIPTSSLSGSFQIILRAITEGSTNVDVTIQPQGETQGVEQRGVASLPLCLSSWCYDGIAMNVDPLLGDSFVLGPGTWQITVGINTQGGARVLLDRVIALPVEYADPSTLLGMNSALAFTTTCNVRTNDIRLGTADEAFCLANVFSLTTFYFDGAMLCDCNLVGSVDALCESYGGQCTCKTGVGGRTCDACLPEYFSFRSTGCAACDCFSDDKVCDMTTGQCNCPPNTAGRRCDRCVTFAWGLNSTTGCQECNCNPIGSVSLQCDQTTGQCHCQPGVGGRDCSVCLDGFKELTSSGCEPCDCDVDGSLTGICDQVTGQCVCKANTEGLTCDTCRAGTFYNSEANPSGCLECICMGITSECDSTTQRSIQTTVPTNENTTSEWSVFITASSSQVPPVTVGSTIISDVDVVTAILGEGISAVWRLPTSDFSGNLLGLYGQRLTFDLVYFLDSSVNPDQAVAMDASITIQSPTTRLNYVFGTSNPGVLTPVSVEMSELSGWVDVSSSLPVPRARFLTTLSDVTSILVTASLSSAAHASSIGNVNYYSATSPGSPGYTQSAPRALAVEQCNCGPQYNGLSCEECASGYYRVNVTFHEFFGVCVPCECNGHSSTCDPDTGECLECQDNTSGFNCQLCSNGYYGDATLGTSDDCQPCPCGPPTAQTNLCALTDGIVTCLNCSDGHLGPLCNICDNFYFGQPESPGGFCQPCECNRNTDSCNSVTGECLNCGFSTTGFNCERCQNFTYGSAPQQNCQACDCSPTGSEHLLCDHLTGQCPCLPGVRRRQCDSCLPNFYGFGNPMGCFDCACNEFGSQTLQCDEASGRCSCLAGVLGAKCDTCEDGSYGLPGQACVACDCNAMGTVGGAQAVCDIFTGQCPCKVGITARVCDECLPGYINFSANGCTKCDQCVDTLYNSTRDLETLYSQLQELGGSIEQLQQRDAELRILDPDVRNTTEDLLQLMNDFLALRSDVEGIDSGAFQRDVNLLADMASALAATMEALMLRSTNQLDQINVLQVGATRTLNNVLVANATVMRYLDLMMSWNESTATMVGDAVARMDSVGALSVMEQRAAIEVELGRIENVSLEADALFSMVTVQGRELNQLVAAVTSAEAQFQATQQLVSSIHTALDTVEVLLGDTDTIINATQTNQAYSNRLLSEAETLLASVMMTLTRSRQAIVDADQALQDVNIIYLGSSLGNAAIPLDVPIDQLGVNGWVDGNLRVTGQLGVVQGLQPNLEIAVAAAETQALALETETQQSLDLFRGAQAHGQRAVDTILGYRQVVTTLGEAGATVQNASDSLASTQQYLTTRSVTTLSGEALALQQASTDLRDLLNSSTTDTQGLSDALDAANGTLQDAIALWDTVRQEVVGLESEVNALTALSSNPQIQPVIQLGMEDSNQTIEMANAILENTTSLDEKLTSHEENIVFIQENINNASVLITGLPASVSQTESNLEMLNTSVNTLVNLQNDTAALRSGINDRIARLREKLRLAQTTIADSNQPVRFAGRSSVSIIQPVDTPALYNELRLNVKPDQRDGLVFFTENPSRNSFMSVEVIASRINFRFSIIRDIVTVSSPIDVCCGEWYRVLATRYADGGELTVTLLSTGGSSSNYARSFSVYERFMHFEPNTTFFVGGIPMDYQLNTTLDIRSQTDKILSRDFAGCVASVSFDGQQLDLWRPNRLEGSTACCQSPVTPVDPEVPYVPGVSFNGFGYYRVPMGEFDLSEQARVSLEFRTVLKEGVLFVVTRPDLISYLGIYMVDGRVTFEMNTAGNARYSVPTVGMYNDGQWYQVTATFNSSHYSLEMRYANETSRLLEGSTRRTVAPLAFPNLQFSPKLLLAGADPVLSRSVVRGPTNLGFAGSMRNLQLSSGNSIGSFDLVTIQISNTSSLPYQGVSFSGYLEEVVPGIGFSGDFAFAALSLPNLLGRTQVIRFNFKTSQSRGLLAYSYDAVTFNKLVYIALYHGNIFVQYNMGSGLSDPLQTRGLKLNTGQWQTVTVAFNGLTASLKVNDLPMIYGSSQLSTMGIPIDGVNSLLYVGGAPRTIPILIGGDFPVRWSVEGDIADFTVNDVSPNFNDPDIIVSRLGLTLTGVPPPVATLPPLPYVTPPPPTGSMAPGSCADPVQVYLYPESLGVVRFGVTRNSYLAITLNSQERKYFSTTFVLTFEFRALSPNGILLYLANDYASPNQFLSLIMQDGKLNLFVLDRTREFTSATTRYKYDDAEWRTLTILKINGFLVILVTETKDYVRRNNDLIGDRAAILDVGTSLFVGGLGPEVLAGAYPLSADSVDSFNGCIRNMVISTETDSNIPLSLSSPSESLNITTCRQNPIVSGGYFDGSGWLLLDDQFNVTDTWSVAMTISTSDQEALLLAIAADTQNFVTLEIADGAVRAVVGPGTATSYILRSTQLASGFDLCDGNPHNIQLVISVGEIQLTVDDNPADSVFVDSQSSVSVVNQPLYIGGVPDPSTIPLVAGIITTPFRGCMESLLLGSMTYDLHNHVASQGFTVGCPRPIP